MLNMKSIKVFLKFVFNECQCSDTKQYKIYEEVIIFSFRYFHLKNFLMVKWHQQWHGTYIWKNESSDKVCHVI